MGCCQFETQQSSRQGGLKSPAWMEVENVQFEDLSEVTKGISMHS